MFERFDELSTTTYKLLDALDNYDEEGSDANYKAVQSYNADIKAILSQTEDESSLPSPFKIPDNIIPSITDSDQRFFKANAKRPETWNITKEQFIHSLTMAADRVADVFKDHDNNNSPH